MAWPGRFTDLLETDIAERDVTALRGVSASRDALRQAAQTAVELARERVLGTSA
jgi:hypothetical protein